MDLDQSADYCTFFPDIIGKIDLRTCCAAHDLDYANPAIDRLTADIDLAACVAATSGGPIMGSVMFVGVALFGWWFRRKALRRAQAR